MGVPLAPHEMEESNPRVLLARGMCVGAQSNRPHPCRAKSVTKTVHATRKIRKSCRASDDRAKRPPSKHGQDHALLFRVFRHENGHRSFVRLDGHRVRLVSRLVLAGMAG